MINPVEIREEALVLPTYTEPEREPYPMFAENRVHQRSSGNPYPNQVVLDVNRTHRIDQAYRAIRLENEYLRVVVLPDIGGRIYSAYDKVNQYDFFYKQHVIKPALIGLLGSWVSGGVEFNWPCHHRPSTFMPCDYTIEREDDGSATVWLSEHEPLDRMKGMFGIRLAAGSSLLETKMRVYNRGELRRSFLWWENAAVPVNEQYRLFFPPDVRHVQFHYRKGVTTYPVAQGQYNGIWMGDGTDISHHKNTRQPTSYFSAPSRYDFFGGYDEGRGAGVVHVANRHTSPGKKMFTWAYNQLSKSWERALTDTDGAYAELMAGSYTDNQPDFAWLEAYETKTFTQCWYPIGAMGAPQCANSHAAVRFGEDGVHLQGVRAVENAVAQIDGQQFSLSLTPGVPVFLKAPGASRICLRGAKGEELLCYERREEIPLKMPTPLPANPTLCELSSAQDYYLAGVHVQQYRDPAIRADGYWQAALDRDPQHVPSLTALGYLRYECGLYRDADALAERAWQAVTRWNYHPETGKLPLLRGLIASAMGDSEAAYEWFYRASWNADSLREAMIHLARLDAARGDANAMADHAAQAIATDARCGHARALYALALLRQGRRKAAADCLRQALASDPLDHLLRWILWNLEERDLHGYYAALRSDPAQTCLDIACDLHALAEDQLAVKLLVNLPEPTAMTAYCAMHFGADRLSVPRGYGIAYPSRREEEGALMAQIARHPQDTQAHWGLGCWLYGKRRYAEAAEKFRDALAVDAACIQAMRGLAIAYFSHLGRRGEALALLQTALKRSPCDQQLLFETAYVMTRLRRDPAEKAALIRAHLPDGARDDLLVELAQAENLSGAHERALEILTSHAFTPCEGGEHAVAEQYMFAHYALGRRALDEGRHQDALSHFEAAQALPDSLGAGLWNEVLKTPHRYYQALCLYHMGQADRAREIWTALGMQRQDYFSDMHLPELPCWQAMCHARLGHAEVGRQIAADHFGRYQKARAQKDAGFYRTTPFFLCYIDDAASLRCAVCDYQQAMAMLAVGDTGRAAPLFARALAGEPGHLYAAYEGANALRGQ